MGGRRPDGADPDGLVTCLGCGWRGRSLGPHIWRRHQQRAAAYRAEHGLPATAALMAPATRQLLSTGRRAAMTERPELVERMRAATPAASVLAARSAEGRAGTDGLPAVRAARRRGARQTIGAAQEARRAQLDEIARAAGFAGMEDAVRRTRHLPSRAAATQIGVGASTVKRWRAKPT